MRLVSNWFPTANEVLASTAFIECNTFNLLLYIFNCTVARVVGAQLIDFGCSRKEHGEP